MNPETEALADYFKGMARYNLAAVRDAAEFDGWQELARDVLRHRRQDWLRQLPDGDLQAIVEGRIDVAAAARAALASTGARATRNG